MSIRKRLFNAARAEVKDAAERLKRKAEALLGEEQGEAELREEEPVEQETPRARASGARSKKGRVSAEESRLHGWYANLELPIGASSAEVKAAYRRLMRRYHPDLHQADPARAELATKLSQELRSAYEGLIAHLGEK